MLQEVLNRPARVIMPYHNFRRATICVGDRDRVLFYFILPFGVSLTSTSPEARCSGRLSCFVSDSRLIIVYVYLYTVDIDDDRDKFVTQSKCYD